MATETHGAEGSSLVFHPMDQFIVKPLFGGDHMGMFTITNATLWMMLAIVAVIALMVFGTSRRATIPGRAQSVQNWLTALFTRWLKMLRARMLLASSLTS